MPLFPKRPKYTIVKVAKRRGDIPNDLWTKCEDCKELIYNKKLEENMHVCPKCNFHFNLSALDRIKITVDEGTLKRWILIWSPWILYRSKALRRIRKR